MEFLQQNWYWAALAVASGAFLFIETLRQRGDGSSLSPVQATLMINREDATIIDVREQNEFIQGHIPNARHIPLAALEKRGPELEKLKQQPIIVCCASGARSKAAIATLHKLGCEKVFNLQGGMAGWQQAGQPVTRKRK
ncbi:rhodanese-like domain-containing protein [Denitromonas sp.]|uniref:rhodanese-like domain-containing protein n=1 Tax=Denitromonas sp. TaxID=2734609 RepID=UPI002AFFD9AC|nr:rhodanese-like domain-containing protein [Denitromonas sp.]